MLLLLKEELDVDIQLRHTAQITAKLRELWTLTREFHPRNLDHDGHILKEKLDEFLRPTIELAMRCQQRHIGVFQGDVA